MRTAKRSLAAMLVALAIVSTLGFYDALALGGGEYTNANTTTTAANISSKTITLAASAPAG